MMEPRPGGARELLDEGGWSQDVVEGNLRDMERAHVVLGVRRRILAYVDRLAAAGGPLIVLDVGTGSGWLPRALLRRAAARGGSLRVVGLDANPAVLEAARRGGNGPSYCLADALEMPVFRNGVDVVTCSMVLHHVDPRDALALLREVDRVARRGWIVCDLVRSVALSWTARLVTRLFSGNELTRHDGPASARAAFSLNELRELARAASVRAEVRRFSLFCGEMVPKGR